jgi:GH24 family phage-related lysozyme (muramidase)
MFSWAHGVLTDATIAKVNALLTNEELPVAWPYLDSVSTVTIAIGYALPDISDIDSINAINATNNSPATTAEKRAAWTVVQNISTPRGNKSNFAYTHFQNMTHIIVSTDEMSRLLDIKLGQFYLNLVQSYPGFDSMPEPGKIGLFDMIYNLGPSRIINEFPHFTKAVRARDWTTAAAQSERPQLSKRRNATVRTLFLQCAGSSVPPAPPLSPPSKPKTPTSQQNAKLPPPPIPFPPTPFKNQIPPPLRIVTSPLIKQGDRGVDVRTVQYALNRVLAGRLPALALDGVFGPHVGNAVRSAQSHAGIGADGVVGAATRQALDLTLA